MASSTMNAKNAGIGSPTSTSTSTPASMSMSMSISSSKDLIIVRHGQAQHNPRAEVAQANGCSMEEFVEWMRKDDALDATLTDHGREQAQAAQLSSSLASSIQLVVSSSHSRTLETADLVLPPPPPPTITAASTASTASTSSTRRVCVEDFREVTGDMLNAKRRTRSELAQRFPDWNYDYLKEEEDSLWTPTMEALDVAAERGYQGFTWLLQQPEDHQMLVSHGGILRYSMTTHPLVQLADERPLAEQQIKPVEARFDNCEVRRYRLSWAKNEDESGEGDESGGRRAVLLTQMSTSSTSSTSSSTEE